MASLFQDLRYAARVLSGMPGFTAAIILVLALGIGVNSALFSVVNGALLHTLPYPEPDRLVSVFETNPKLSIPYLQPSTANFFDWSARNEALDQIAPWRFGYFNVSGSGEAERLQGFRVSSNFFPLLGSSLALGRAFLPEEEQAGRDRVVVLSHGLWQRRYSSDPGVVGRSIIIDGMAATVVGVLPRDFRILRVLNRELDLYMPLVLDHGRSSRDDHSLNVWARLKPGVTLERASAEMQTIGRRLAHEYPETNSGWDLALLTLPETFVLRNRPAVVVLAVATGFILLIVCVNVANLLLARASSRQREMAIRTALGAPRLRLLRQLLTESLMLAVLGGAAGLLVATWILRLLNSSVTYLQVTRVMPFRIDAEVFACTLAVALVTGILFGLAPGIESSRLNLNETLREGGRGSSASRGSRQLSDWLVVSEVALAVLLLVGAGVMLQSSLSLVLMDRGLNPRNVLTMQVWLQKNKYATAQQVANFFDETLGRVQKMPGVESASVVNYPPAGLLSTSVKFSVEGIAHARPGEPLAARYWVIGPDYFRTVGIPLISGRAFTGQDADETRGSVIVSESFARRFWPGKNPLGERIHPRFPNSDAFWRPYSANLPLTIVGVAANVKEDGLDNAGMPQLYLPYRQNPSQIMHLVVRTSGAPKQWTAAIRSAVAAVDPDQPVSEIKTLEEVSAEAFSRRSGIGYLMGIFAACALVLAAMGIYAVLSYSVNQRSHEIGVRMALGARRASVIRMVMGHAMRLVLLGVGMGLGASFGLTRTLAGLLYGVRMDNFGACAVAALLLIAVAALASYLPARRATRIDPLNALRFE